MTLTAGNLLVDGQGFDYFTGISSQASTGSTGAGGDVNLTVAETLTLINGSQISAGTWGTSDGGDVRITAGRSVNITGGIVQSDTFYPSGLFVSAYSAGKAGDITLDTPTLTISDGGSISGTSSQTTGGNLFINADHLKMFDGNISSTAFGDVPGSDGGNVTLNGSTITARANKGQGGNITVNADVFLHDAPSTDDVLNASSDTFGNDGTVELNAPTTDISGSLVTLNTPYLDVAGQLSPGCVGGKFAEERNRFIIQGRGALPLGPDDLATVPVSQCVPESLALASPAAEVANDALPPPSTAEPPDVAGFGFNNR